MSGGGTSFNLWPPVIFILVVGAIFGVSCYVIVDYAADNYELELRKEKE